MPREASGGDSARPPSLPLPPHPPPHPPHPPPPPCLFSRGSRCRQVGGCACQRRFTVGRLTGCWITVLMVWQAERGDQIREARARQTEERLAGCQQHDTEEEQGGSGGKHYRRRRRTVTWKAERRCSTVQRCAKGSGVCMKVKEIGGDVRAVREETTRRKKHFASRS